MTDPKPLLTVGIPTVGRAEKLRHCVNSVLALAGCPVRVVLLFGDYTAYHHFPDIPGVFKFLQVPRRYYVADVNTLFAKMHQWEDLDFFAITNDDSEFVMPNWGIRTIDTLMNNFEDGMGVIEMFVSGMHDYLSRAKLFDEHYGGKLLPEHYVHFCADSERTMELRKNEQFVQFVPIKWGERIIRHEAYMVDDALSVENQEMWHARDHQVFEERKKLYE
jgi:glycosyltransferase involved in cell wall biosynthesis